MSTQVIRPACNLSGAVRPPGDKSISHRYGMLGALASGRSHLANYSTGADCASTLACMAALGAKIERRDDVVEIEGAGLRGLRPPAAPLDAGNSGSTIRMLAGILAGQPFASEIGGDASLSRRPMRRVVEPLQQMGAAIAAAEGGLPPLRFAPAPSGLSGIEYRLPVASAQVKTAVLFAGLFARGATAVIEPQPTRDHTEIALRQCGARISVQRGRVELAAAPGELRPVDLTIPGDPSSAAFFLCAAAMFPEATLVIQGVSVNPRRAVLLDVLRRMGARIGIVEIAETAGELVGTLSAAGPARGRLQGTSIAGAETVALIDEIPVLAVLATACEGGLHVADAAELRVKESDRIAAIAENLRRMGARCEERPDGLIVPGPQQLHAAAVDSRGDHRIAMAFAIAGLVADGPVEIAGADCAAISYPEFYSTLARITD
ncbi:MAG TPA: 3-phosphoshikimate 1-carboxyvinyltransferase [Terriglobales bacterium]|nr:3-phosphoshikimate 1-carboxyvinyltransferase [Terriglobales bacterium]